MSDPHNWSPTERELAAFDNRNVCDGCGRPVEDGGAPAPVGMGREVEAIALLREVADPDEQDMPASLGSVLLMRGRPLHDRILAFLAAAPEHQATPAGPEKSPAGARASAPPADSDGDGCQACVDGVDHISCEPTRRPPRPRSNPTRAPTPIASTATAWTARTQFETALAPPRSRPTSRWICRRPDPMTSAVPTTQTPPRFSPTWGSGPRFANASLATALFVMAAQSTVGVAR